MNPLVSCIMPTKDRRDFIPAAIQVWSMQTYEPRELIILADEPKDLLPEMAQDERVVERILNEPMTLGAKRNRCIELAAGDIIIHFDDDDWSKRERIAQQVEYLLAGNKGAVGYMDLVFWDTRENKAKFWQSEVPGYVCGTSLCYYRDFGLDHPFPNIQISSDTRLVNSIRHEIGAAHSFGNIVARIHAGNTNGKGNIKTVVGTEFIPNEFWENEKLRLSCRQ